jgi:tetraacyldisaccharide 4'-kinase
VGGNLQSAIFNLQSSTESAVSWSRLLLPLTPLYSVVVRARAAAYRRGVLKVHRLEVPVVSVGNISFGGTGKTPVVAALARDLIRRGRRPAILTRGYGRTDDQPVVVVGPDHGETAASAGDEPLELAQRLPGVPIVVDADRVRGGGLAVDAGADLMLLDDGFQHLRLWRDVDLVVVDAGDPFGSGSLPPRGRLREPLSALARASAVLVTKVAAGDDEVVRMIADTVSRIAGPIPVMTAAMKPRRVRTRSGWQPPERLAGARVMAFAGIGRPEGFVRLLADAGAEVVETRWFRDHHRYASAELDGLMAEAAARGLTPVTTAKDAVKLPPETPAWVVEADLVPRNDAWQVLWDLLVGDTS